MALKPGSSPISAERIERLQKRRTRIFLVEALLFAIWQVNYFAAIPAPKPLATSLETMKVSAYVVWAVALLVALATGGGFRYGREVRAILNDETTRDHRRRGLECGFWAAMGVALICYALSIFEPISARIVIHLILSGGLATALLTFVYLERRAQADG